VEWQGVDYKWYWNGRGWSQYLNEAKTYDGEAAQVASKSIGLSMSGSCYVSNLNDEIVLAQIQAKATIAAEQARVARDLEKRNKLTQALDVAGIAYVTPENTSAILVNVDGRGSVGISEAGYTAYIYNDDNCFNVTSFNDVINIFRGNYGD
jgi:hypothetical protein